MNAQVTKFYYVLRAIFDGSMVLILNNGTQFLFIVPFALIILAIPVAILKWSKK